MFEDDAEELEQFIASDSEEEAKSTGSEPTNSDSEEEVIVKKRKVTTRKTREETKEDLSKGIIFLGCAQPLRGSSILLQIFVRVNLIKQFIYGFINTQSNGIQR